MYILILSHDEMNHIWWKTHPSVFKYGQRQFLYILACARQNQYNDALPISLGIPGSASAQSDHSLRCLHEESFGPWIPFEQTAKTDQTEVDTVLVTPFYSLLIRRMEGVYGFQVVRHVVILISFPLNTLRTNWWNLTKFCICIDIDKMYV